MEYPPTIDENEPENCCLKGSGVYLEA